MHGAGCSALRRCPRRWSCWPARRCPNRRAGCCRTAASRRRNRHCAASASKPTRRRCPPDTRAGSYGELFRPPFRARVLLVALIFFLNCISGPLSTIAAPFVLRTVGALSNETTLLFSTLVWCTSLCGVLVGLLLIDRIGRRRLLYIAVFPRPAPRSSWQSPAPAIRRCWSAASSRSASSVGSVPRC